MSLYTINEQEPSHLYKQNAYLRYKESLNNRKIVVQAQIAKCLNELQEAIETGETLKKQPECYKQLFSNEKKQETVRCRLYRAQDKLDAIIKQEHMSPRQRRKASSVAACEENLNTKKYIQEVFEKAQLDIAIGNVKQQYPSRGRYSIPHTIRE